MLGLLLKSFRSRVLQIWVPIHFQKLVTPGASTIFKNTPNHAEEVDGNISLYYLCTIQRMESNSISASSRLQWNTGSLASLLRGFSIFQCLLHSHTCLRNWLLFSSLQSSAWSFYFPNTSASAVSLASWLKAQTLVATCLDSNHVSFT